MKCIQRQVNSKSKSSMLLFTRQIWPVTLTSVCLISMTISQTRVLMPSPHSKSRPLHTTIGKFSDLGAPSADATDTTFVNIHRVPASERNQMPNHSATQQQVTKGAMVIKYNDYKAHSSIIIQKINDI